MDELEPFLDDFDICGGGPQRRAMDWYPGGGLGEALASGLLRSWRPRIHVVHEA